MEHRTRPFGSRLLAFRRVFTFLALLFLAFPGGAQEEAEEPADVETPVEENTREPLTVTTTNSPTAPVVGGSWTITVLSDHPVSQEVTVRPPPFPSNLLLERVRTETRMIRQPIRQPAGEEDPLPQESRRWTAVEFLFSLHLPGTITLAPFEVIAPNKQGATGPITLQIREAAPVSRRNTPAFRWERLPASLTLGQATELTLVLVNWDPGKPAPENLFRGKIPEKTILEELPCSVSGQTIRYPIRIIPLEGEIVVLGPLAVLAEGENGPEIPRFSLRVMAPRAPALAPVQDKNPGEPSQEDAPEGTPSTPPPFPKRDGKIFFLFQDEYDRITREVRELWEQGRRAQGLATLRANERDRLSGLFLVPLRRETEKELGLPVTPDEPWGIWNHPAFRWILLAVLSLSGAIILKSRGSRRLILPVFAAGLGAVFLFAGLAAYFGTSPRGSAVLEETPAYRVPDVSGTLEARFQEGQPVRIRSSSGVWMYAETMDGRAGWVLAEKAIPY